MWLHHPYLLKVPIGGLKKCGYIPLPPPGSRSGDESMWLHNHRHVQVPIVGSNSGGIALPSQGPYSGNQSMCLHNPCLLGDPVVESNYMSA